MSWILLLIAGVLEVAWAVGMKYSHGFTKPGPSVFTILTMAASVVCLALSMRTLPLGTAYAIWTGIGTVGTVIVGMVAFGESTSVFRMIFLSLIVFGILGLKLFAVK